MITLFNKVTIYQADGHNLLQKEQATVTGRLLATKNILN